ncbi:FeoB-associated Cys-rich membrane protein [Flavobacterium wongokense]|uniref:FeoB-associated Cys-rich membrane protein n=1 Tax=Flavobacterium wongokense TaxID=2910674 RepID=UPI00351CCB99
MAYGTINFHEWICLYNCADCVSILEMMGTQEILVYLTVAAALAFIIRKFFWKRKSKKNCGDDDCGCH